MMIINEFAAVRFESPLHVQIETGNRHAVRQWVLRQLQGRGPLHGQVRISKII